jgi:TRAP-type C4-dicarboxylate transport system substrate-binding protein
MKNLIVTSALSLALIGGLVHAQTSPAAPAPAAATASTDPVVVLRNEQRAARNAFNEAAKPIRAERAATVKAAVDKAEAEARASGKDPVVAGRVARRQAMQATKPDFDAKMKAITETRREAMAAAKAKRAAAKP